MKAMDFDENCGFWSENHRFCQKLPILMKIVDFDEI